MFEKPPKHLTIDSLEQLCDLGRSTSIPPEKPTRVIAKVETPKPKQRAEASSIVVDIPEEKVVPVVAEENIGNVVDPEKIKWL